MAVTMNIRLAQGQHYYRDVITTCSQNRIHDPHHRRLDGGIRTKSPWANSHFQSSPNNNRLLLGAICPGDFVLQFFRGGVCPGGICSGGFCSGGLCHGFLNDSSSPVLRATSCSHLKGQISTVHKIKTHELMEIKFGSRDYVHDVSTRTNFGSDRFNGGRKMWSFFALITKYCVTVDRTVQTAHHRQT